MDKEINLLIITSLWPKSDKDISGIFIVDYAKAVQSHCKVSVLNIRLVGGKKGLTTDELNGFKIYKYCVSEQYLFGIKKFLMYLKWFYMGRRLGRGIHGINLIHAHGSTLCGNLGYLLAHRLRIPLVITEHAGPFCKLLKNPVSRWLTKNALQKANVVMTVSADLKKQIETSNIEPKRIAITYNPVDVDLFKRGNDFHASNIKNIIYVGRLEEYKGGLRVVKAFQQLLIEFPDWHLTLIGDGPEFDSIMKLLSNSKKIKTGVILKGQLAKEKVAEEMRRASFFVYPSRHETFGIVVAEAMASGLPVIVGRGTAMDEFVDESSGIFVDPDNIAGIADAMKCMILNIDKYNTEQIRQQVIDRFGFQAFGKRLIEMYESVIR